ncbi:hypothetical protein WN943_005094 [Citrus x changshan-huyou]
MDEMNDSVSSNPEQFLNDGERLFNGIAADSNENQGGHDPHPFWKFEAQEGTSTSMLDLDWCWPDEISRPGGHTNNHNSSDCWSAASEAHCLNNNFLPAAAAASDAVFPPLLNVVTDGAENADAAVMKRQLQNTEKPLEMVHNSLQHLPSFDTHIVSLESDGESLMSSESNGDEIQSQSTVNLRGEIPEVNSQNPELGMVFSSQEEAYMFYTTYAKRIGFSVRKAKVRRLSNGAIRKRLFYCSRQGFRAKKQSTKATKYQRKETRTGCDAMVEFTVENGKWMISGFTPEHNHDLEGKSKPVVGSSTKVSEDHSISTTMNKAATVKEAQPLNSVGFQGINCPGIPCDEKTSCPKLLDGQSLIKYFRRLEMEAPSFSYTVQVNAENCLTGFFWTDGRSRIDYDYFGDVVILDTTFRIEANNMIYAPFLGLNHHRQYVLFGGAFLLDDSKDSFIWLLRTFLDSMGRRQPSTIFTDGYQAMADAIKMVLPKTQHLLGIWYILRNAKANLSKCYGEPGFNSLFNKCIFDCESEAEFESMWESLLEQYELCANPWLKTQYMLRRKWAHCFCKSAFSAGIRSTQHCYDISHVFHSLTSKATTPLQFVQQYFKVAEQQRRKELYEDFRCNGSAPPTILRSNAIEKEAAKIYSCTMFKLFRAELLECLSVAIEEIQGDGMTAKFRLNEEGQKKEKIVEFNCVETHLTCSCKKYESVGILCVHALKVLNAKNIFHIPPQYILKRWTKSAKDGMVVNGHEGEVVDDSQRHLHLDESKLMHKALNVITKSLPFEGTRMIADDYLSIALKNIEDALRTKNIGQLNTRDVYDAYKDAAAAADANGIISVKTQRMESNPSTVNQQEALNYRIKCQLKRKYDNDGRETKSKSSDGAITHRHSFKEVTKGGDYQGSKKHASRSYSVGENSRHSACVSALPPLPSQSTGNQFKDHNKSRLNVQVRLEETEKERERLEEIEKEIKSWFQPM